MTIVFKTPTFIFASASTADGITDVTVAKIFVDCAVAAPAKTGIVSSRASPFRSVPVILKVVLGLELSWMHRML